MGLSDTKEREFHQKGFELTDNLMVWSLPFRRVYLDIIRCMDTLKWISLWVALSWPVMFYYQETYIVMMDQAHLPFSALFAALMIYMAIQANKRRKAARGALNRQVLSQDGKPCRTELQWQYTYITACEMRHHLSSSIWCAKSMSSMNLLFCVLAGCFILNAGVGAMGYSVFVLSMINVALTALAAAKVSFENLAVVKHEASLEYFILEDKCQERLESGRYTLVWRG